MDRERNPNRPGIGETIFAAGSLVHSHPAILVGWLFLALASAALIHFLAASAPFLGLRILGYLLYGLADVFFAAGFMGSFALILKLGRWRPAAVIESGRHYFWRFLLLGIIQVVLMTVIPAVLGILFALAGGQIHRILIFLMIPLVVGGVVLHFFLVFARAGVVVEENGVFEAIAYSFRVVRFNFLPTLVFILVLMGIPALLAFLIGLLYGSPGGGLELPKIFFSTLLTAYGHLLLMAALVYFAVEIGRPPEEEI